VDSRDGASLSEELREGGIAQAWAGDSEKSSVASGGMEVERKKRGDAATERVPRHQDGLRGVRRRGQLRLEKRPQRGRSALEARVDFGGRMRRTALRERQRHGTNVEVCLEIADAGGAAARNAQL
jgi:hypothetical protein